MTRETAISIFKRLKENAPNEMHLETVGSAQELFSMAIKALEQDPCTDATSREAVIGELKDMYKAAERWSQNATEDDIKARADAVMATLLELTLRVEDLPSVTPSRQKGRWIESKTYTNIYDCSECESAGFYTFKYCPNCGAEMGE